MTNREIFAKMTLTCAKVAKLQKEQNEAIEVIKDCFCKTGIMYHPANEPPPETAPKYDPCRLFRKGDKVRLVEYKGRHFNTDAKRMWFCTGIVTSSECEHEYIDVCVSFGNTEEDIEIDPAYLELVKPVEELEPYSIGKSDYNGFVNIEKNGKIIAMIPYGKELHEHKTEAEAKAAAEAERDRLNAEYRKEMMK